MERRKIFLIGLILFFLMKGSFAGEKNFDKYFLSSYPDIIKVILDNKDQLNLSTTQNEAIEAAISQYEPMINERKKQIDQLEKDLQDLILHGGESSKIKSIILKLAQLKSENLVLKIKEIREIQNNLTESQYKKILSYLEGKSI
ncbi:hypothetical protein [Hydrogenivirga sp. 128-5-R1-1]|uniref:hypothetical protein n=1 Tax=Hydrogenivirga sp. 128-5-R1-1 TaxID=392423 RepID=UPI00015F2D49|nr:hypothetical protein [Hydrogenivirga sp. 128-5-R1-1]EDP74024.1 hypothetical protein HG1285_05268 [Hydrogenivirga sp. 128-5-R1-1]